MVRKNLDLVIRARDEASKKIGLFSKNLGGLKKRLIGMFAGIGLVAGVYGLVRLVKSNLKAIDSIGKMSSELQISTEALIGFEHASKIAGSSITDVHKGLQIMTRRLGEAKEGYGEGLRGLKAMNVSAEEMMALGTEKAFLRIADAVAKSKTATEKANIAYQMFGRGGVQMINMLNMGSEGLREMREETVRLGISFSRLDAAKVEEANDAMERAKEVFLGIGQTLTIELADDLAASAQMFVAWATTGEGAAGKLKKAIKGIGLEDGFLGRFVDMGAAGWQFFKLGEAVAKDWWAGYGTGAKNIKQWIDEIIKWEAPTEEFEKFKQKLIAGLEEVQRQAKKVEETDVGAERKAEQFAKIGEAVSKVNEKLLEQIELYGMTAREKQLAKLEKLGEGLIGKDLKDFNAQLEMSKKLISDINLLEMETKEEEAFKKRTAEMDKYVKRIKEMIRTPAEVFQDVQKKLKAALDVGKLNLEEFAKARNKFAEDIFGPIDQKTLQIKTPRWQAFESRFKIDVPRVTYDPAIETARNTKEQRDLQKKMLSEAKKTNSNLEKISTGTTGILQTANL